MLHDPPTDSEGDCPYDALAGVGIGPRSTMKEVLDCSFALMKEGRWTPEVRTAWNELRMVESRLLVDFLLPDPAVPAEVSRARAIIVEALLSPAGSDAVEYDR